METTDEENARTADRGRMLALAAPPLALVGGLGVLGVVRERLQRRQMFEPSVYPKGSWTPARHGVAAEDHWFRTDDDVDLHGWWVPHPRARGTILYCHGNKGSLGSQMPTLRRLRRLRCHLFAFDYRGYGRSDGRPRESGLYRDVRAAYRHLTESVGVDPGQLLLFGHSLGGAVAIDAATEVEAAGLIVQSSLTQMRDMARVSSSNLPMHWVARNQFRSIDKIGRVPVPKLIVHGRLDARIPIAQGRELFGAASEPKAFLEVPGAGHDDVLRQGRARYWLQLARFRDRCLDPGS